MSSLIDYHLTRFAIKLHLTLQTSFDALPSQEYLPLFQMAGSSTVYVPDSKYDPLVAGCSRVHCCKGNADCNAANALSSCICYTSDVTDAELQFAGLSSVNPTTPAWILFLNQSAPPTVIDDSSSSYLVNGDTWSALDPCAISGQSVRCSLADEVIHDDCTYLVNSGAQAIRNIYCSNYIADGSTNQCVYNKAPSTGLTCLSGRSIANTRFDSALPRAIKLHWYFNF